MNNGTAQAANARRMKQNMDQKTQIENLINGLKAENAKLIEENKELREDNIGLANDFKEAQVYMESLRTYVHDLEKKLATSNKPVTDIYIEDLPIEFGESLEGRLNMFMKYLHEGNVKVMSRRSSFEMSPSGFGFQEEDDMMGNFLASMYQSMGGIENSMEEDMSSPLPVEEPTSVDPTPVETPKKPTKSTTKKK